MLVELSHVSHKFGNVSALDDVNAAIPQGSITALLGPNGAGKTTAIRLITGVITPDSGTVRVFGLDPASDGYGREVRSQCGVVSAKPSLYDRLSGLDNLLYAAELYGVGRSTSAAIEAAGMFGIVDALNQTVGGYSTGMKTRLALARCIIHKPSLLLLDEPTSGLDPESAATVLDLIRNLATDGRTVIMCTHLLGEADGLAGHVVVMDQGSVLVAGAPDELAHAYWPSPMVKLASERGDDLDRLATAAGVTSYHRDGLTATITIDTASRIPDLVYVLTINGARLTMVEPFRPTLEDTYFAIRSSDPAPSPPVVDRGTNSFPAYVGNERRTVRP